MTIYEIQLDDALGSMYFTRKQAADRACSRLRRDGEIASPVIEHDAIKLIDGMAKELFNLRERVARLEDQS